MNNLSQYDGWTAEDLVRKHGCDALTAMHVIQAREFILEERERHEKELCDMRQYIDNAARIGHRVLEAARKGRKTVRIEEVIR